MSDSNLNLFCFGLGYCALRLIKSLDITRWSHTGTKQKTYPNIITFNENQPLLKPELLLKSITHLLISIPPKPCLGDIVLLHHKNDFPKMKKLQWIGYLSTTGVYGNTKGELVTESSKPKPTSERSQRRLKAEKDWMLFAKKHSLPLHIFRLPGIYGPNRSVIDQLNKGTAHRIVKKNHRFSRIHVDDICQILIASMKNPNFGDIYNVCDDVPAAPEEVVNFAANLMGIKAPPRIPFSKAKLNMSQMALSFWNDNRIVDNSATKKILGITLKYPSYQEGLTAIYKDQPDPIIKPNY